MADFSFQHKVQAAINQTVSKKALGPMLDQYTKKMLRLTANAIQILYRQEYDKQLQVMYTFEYQNKLRMDNQDKIIHDMRNDQEYIRKMQDLDNRIKELDNKVVDCKVCFDKLTDSNQSVLVPCGHSNICSTCVEKLDLCPICRAKINIRQKIIFV